MAEGVHMGRGIADCGASRDQYLSEIETYAYVSDIATVSDSAKDSGVWPPEFDWEAGLQFQLLFPPGSSLPPDRATLSYSGHSYPYESLTIWSRRGDSNGWWVRNSVCPNRETSSPTAMEDI